MEKRENPICFRPTEDDLGIIDYLKKRLGASVSDIIKIALRRLRDEEKRREKR
jgi:hypothetical protein